MTAVLDVQNLRTEFTTPRGVLKAVNDVSFQVRRGEVLGLVGESGSGKSMTGFSIMGLIDAPGKITNGKVMLDGTDLLKLNPENLRSLRGNRLAMIFQDPMGTLHPLLSVGSQLIETLKAHEKISHADARKRAKQALELVGIADAEKRLDAYPHQLSGGMRQRVAIAIALLHRPQLIIADEPTTALDVTIQGQILAVVQDLVREFQTSLIWITHDLALVSNFADQIAVMYAGQIVEQGITANVINGPRHPYTRGLIQSSPSQTPRGQQLPQIKGNVGNPLDLPPGCPFQKRCPRVTDVCQQVPPLTTYADGTNVRCFHPHIDEAISSNAG